MVQANTTYLVKRLLPRKGETYAVKDRCTGITTIKVADHDFGRDRRLVFVPKDAA